MSVESLFALLSFSPTDWLLIAGAIALAYVVFGIAGFGTALVAGPLLVSSLPMARIIALLVRWISSHPPAAGLRRARRWLGASCAGCCPAWRWAAPSVPTGW